MPTRRHSELSDSYAAFSWLRSLGGALGREKRSAGEQMTPPQLTRYARLLEGPLLQDLARLSGELVTYGDLQHAAMLPDPQEVARTLAELAGAAATCDGDRLETPLQDLERYVALLGDGVQRAESLRRDREMTGRRERNRRGQRVLLRLGAGALRELLQDSSFARSFWTDVIVTRRPELSRPPPAISLPSELRLDKPPGSKVNVSEPPVDGTTSKLCEVQDLPLTTAIPLDRHVTLARLQASDFAMQEPLDADSPPSVNRRWISRAVQELAEQQGEPVAYYFRSEKTAYELGQAASFEALRTQARIVDHLWDAATHLVLYADEYKLLLQVEESWASQIVYEGILDFRAQLGWGGEPRATPTPPALVAPFIDDIPSLPELLHTVWHSVISAYQTAAAEQDSGYDADVVKDLGDVVEGVKPANATDRGEAFCAAWREQLQRHLETIYKTRSRIPTHYLPIVLLPRSGAFGETPDLPYRAVELPASRKNSFMTPDPQIGLLKEYELALHHWGFGVGAHLYSQSLLPGESVSIEMRSSSKRKITVTENTAEKVIEESESESLNDLARELESQRRNESEQHDSSKSSVSVSANASFGGVFGASASASGSWSAQSDEKDVASQAQKLMSKLASKLSQERQVTFELQSERSWEETTEEEAKTVRKFQNVNAEKTLTVSFFQITRQIRSTLLLKDLRLFYSSGRYRLLQVYVNRDLDLDAEYFWDLEELQPLRAAIEEQGGSVADLTPDGLFTRLHADVAPYFPEDALIPVFVPSYTVLLPLSGANAFLLRHLVPTVARQISEAIWPVIGAGVAAPEGLGVAAFPFTETEQPELWPEGWDTTAKIGAYDIAGDVVTLDHESLPPMPNLDLRYRPTGMRWIRYRDDEGGPLSLPKTAWSADTIVSTNGVYAENIVGHCSALETFALENRELDLQAKATANRREIEALRADRLDNQTKKALLLPDPSLEETKFAAALERVEKLHQAASGAGTQIRLPKSAEVNLSVDVAPTEAGTIVRLDEEGD